MHFPRYWAKERVGDAACWGWSDVSLDEARHKSAKRAAELAKILQSQSREKLNRYGYADSPLREEVIQELKSASGSTVAALTRNSYGCLVLNTGNLLMIDVDLPQGEPAKSSTGFLSRLFGAGKGSPAENPAQDLDAQAKSWVRLNPSWNLRLYQTAAGHRILVTHDAFEPGDPAVEKVFDHFGCDPLYRKLCKTQKSFRARLTPKPWRCGYHAPEARWPWESPEVKGKFEKWERGYSDAMEGFATCKLLAEIGSKAVLDDFSTILDLHDAKSKALESGSLA